MVRTDGCGDAGGRCGANGRSDPATGGGRPTADGGPTDGLRRKGCLVWNRALVLMVSLAEKPLTGEPDAGNPPLRFGGRGGANPAIPTPIIHSALRSSAKYAGQGCVQSPYYCTSSPS